MKAFRHIFAGAMALCALGAAASPAAPDGEPSLMLTNRADSASAAVATMWARYLLPSLERDPKFHDASAIDGYMEGVAESVGRRGATDPRTRGMLDGIQLASRLAEIESMGIALDTDAFLKALTVALKNRPTGFTPETANAFMEKCLHDQNTPDAAYMAAQEEFIAREAAREGAVTTPDGLVFQVVTEGEGAMPQADDRVKVNYVGKLADGTTFDSSYERNEPAVFGVSQLIPGFTEGLKMMKPGGTYRLVIPASLGYGDRGAGGKIPGGAALDFTVELLEVIPAK